MNPGDFNRRISLQKRTVIKKPGGDDEVVWYIEDAITVWALITPLTGREYIEAGALAAPEIIKVRTWFRPGVSPQTHRLAYNGKVFTIESVTDTKTAHIEMELTCTEEPNAVAVSAKPQP